MSLTNSEINRMFGIKNIRDVVKRVDLPMEDEVIKIKHPILGMVRHNIPPQFLGGHHCHLCMAGKILFDTRLLHQKRQCQNCSNVFDIKKTNRGTFKRKWDPFTEPTKEGHF